ncbi:hypothetical protein AB0D86_27165 [Streptomyces sp. NPDC048324]
MTSFPETMDFSADRGGTLRAVSRLTHGAQESGHLRPASSSTT